MHDLLDLKRKAKASSWPSDKQRYLVALQAEFEAGRLQHVPVDIDQAAEVTLTCGVELTAQALVEHIADTLVAKGAGLLTTEEGSFGQMLIEYVVSVKELKISPTANEDIHAERTRQIQKGYDADHDARHTIGELIASDWGAIPRLNEACVHGAQGRMADYRQSLVKSAALIVAEINRIDNEEAR